MEHSVDVVIAEDLLGARQADCCPGDHDRLSVIDGARAAIDRHALVEEVGEQTAELGISIATRPRRACLRARRRRNLGNRRRGNLSNRSRRGPIGAHLRGSPLTLRGAVSTRIEAAQRTVEGRKIADLRMIGEQGQDVGLPAENVIRETSQRRLGSHLDEHPRACLVQGLEPFHELHGRRDLLSENLDHVFGHVGAHRVELAIDVRDDWHLGRFDAEACELFLERLACGRDNLRVERVAYRQGDRPIASLRDRLHRSRYAGGRPADDRLSKAVDVGDDDIAPERVHDRLHFVDRRQDRSHQAVVFE